MVAGNAWRKRAAQDEMRERCARLADEEAAKYRREEQRQHERKDADGIVKAFAAHDASIRAEYAESLARKIREMEG